MTVGPPSQRAAYYAAVSGSAAQSPPLPAVRRSRWGLCAFRTGVPVASLRSVTEKHPVVTGVRAGVSCRAWVASVRGPVVSTDGPGSAPPQLARSARTS